MEKCLSVAFSCLSGSLNCGDRRLCFQEVGNRHLFPGSAIWRAFFSGNKIKTNMSECSSYSTDANKPGEKLDLCVSGLMVLLYASGNGGGRGGGIAVGRALCVFLQVLAYVRVCTWLCTWLCTFMYLVVFVESFIWLRGWCYHAALSRLLPQS